MPSWEAIVRAFVNASRRPRDKACATLWLRTLLRGKDLRTFFFQEHCPWDQKLTAVLLVCMLEIDLEFVFGSLPFNLVDAQTPWVTMGQSPFHAHLYIGRPTEWGNNYIMKNSSAKERRRVVQAYFQLKLLKIGREEEAFRRISKELGGRVLKCFCVKDKVSGRELLRLLPFEMKCHGHVLAWVCAVHQLLLCTTIH